MYETIASAEWEQEWLYRGIEIPTFSRQAEGEIRSLPIKLDPTQTLIISRHNQRRHFAGNLMQSSVYLVRMP
jgi:hypothetical protein